MKKAKRVEIPEDRPLTTEEFVKLRDHIRNSATWYALERGLNRGTIRNKLKLKGFSDDDVPYFSSSGETVWYNFIDTILDELEELEMINETDFAERLANRQIARGYGINRVRQELFANHVPEDVANGVLQDKEEESGLDSALVKALDRAKLNYAYKKNAGNDFAQEQYLRKTLMQRGFGWDDITRVMESEEEW